MDKRSSDVDVGIAALMTGINIYISFNAEGKARLGSYPVQVFDKCDIMYNICHL